jgi:hypothetical protein
MLLVWNYPSNSLIVKTIKSLNYWREYYFFCDILRFFIFL